MQARLHDQIDSHTKAWSDSSSYMTLSPLISDSEDDDHAPASSAIGARVSVFRSGRCADLMEHH